MKFYKYIPLIVVAIFAVIVAINPLFINATDKEMYWRLRSADQSISSIERLEIIDSLINKCPEMSDSLLFLSADIAYRAGLYQRSLSSLERLYNKQSAKKDISISKKCKLLFQLARVNIKCDNRGNGIDNLVRLLHLHKPDSLLYYDVNGLCLLNEIYSAYSLNGVNDTLHTNKTFISKAEKIIEKAVKSGVGGYPLNEMRKTLLFSKMAYAGDREEYREALEYGSEILNYPINDIEKLALEGNMAMIYSNMGEIELSKEYFEKIINSPAWHSNHGVCLSNYMHLLIGEGRYQEAIDAMEAHPDIVNRFSSGSIYAELLFNRALAHAGSGEYEKAVNDFVRYSHVSDSIKSKIEGEYAFLLFKNIKANYENGDETGGGSYYQRMLWYTLIFSGLVIMLMALGCMIYVRRLREGKISDSEKMLSAQESAEMIDMEDYLKESNVEKDSVVRTLHHASLNETVGNISTILQDQTINESEKIVAITSQIREFTSYDDLWDIFHLQFEKLNPDFFSRLKGKYSDLTQGEMRMCSYVLLNMSNKEIAALTRRSVRSVETMRYRLTKKMNLSSGETLSTHLHTL